MTLTALLVTGLFVGLAGTSRANTGGWDVYGYSWTDSNAPGDQVAFNWIEISGTGTDAGLSGDDVCTYGTYIGFSFEYYGDYYDYAYISSNGMLTFEGTTYEDYNDQIPYSSSPDLVVAPFWDDLVVGPSYNAGAVYYDTIGTTPNSQFVVEWYQVTRHGYSEELTFEVILNETGEIWFQYYSLNGETGYSASVGIEDYYGSVGSQYSYNTASLSDSLAVMFAVGPIGFGSSQSYKGEPGETLYYWLTIQNNQLVSDLFDFSVTSTYGWTATVCDSSFIEFPDSDVDGLPDTGTMASGAQLDVYVLVDIPASPTVRVENTTVTATSDLDISNMAQVVLTSETCTAVFSPPHSDYGYDADTNGLFDNLVIDVAVDVLFDGTYYLYANLYDVGYLDGWYGSYWLTAGSYIISAYFDGPMLFAFGSDGTYSVSLYLYDTSEYQDYDSHITASYLCSAFEPPDAYFLTPNSDAGYDSGSDGLYDYLYVYLGVDAIVEGDYRVEADLYDALGYYVDTVSYDVYLAAGWQQVLLAFDGKMLYAWGVSGTYTVEAYLYDYYWTALDTVDYVTAYYDFDEFQPPDAMFAPPHSEYTVDLNANGYYEYLVVVVSINVTVAGTYEVYGDLYEDGGWDYVTSAVNTTYLDVGVQSVELWFSGYEIYSNYAYGPYEIDLLVSDVSANILDTDTYYTADYYYWEFDSSASWFDPPHSDAGQDTNANGYYEWLVVSVSIYALLEGDYEVSADLYSPSGSYLGYTYVYPYLYEGSNVVDLYFDGFEVFNSGETGMLEVDMLLYYEGWDYQDSDTYTTTSYSYDQFEPPGAFFSPPHSDWGYDTDSNGLYDYLVVEVSIEATIAGDYYLYGYLYDSLYNYLGGTSMWVTLVVGSNAAELSFMGERVYGCRLDGPYHVDLYLYDESWNYLDDDVHNTAAYSYDEFEPPLACFAPPHSDEGVDDDSDSLFEWLAVTAGVEVQSAGTYEVYAVLYSSWDYVASASVTIYLDVGLNYVEMRFPGWIINAMGYDSSFYVDMDVYTDTGTWLDDDEYTTGPYGYDEFDDDVPAIYSQWAPVSPVIDGTISTGEWDDAVVVDMMAADPSNELEAYMLVMNNATHLFIAYDVVGDEYDDWDDIASVGFDNGNDGTLYDADEDQFIMYAYPDMTYHNEYDSWWGDWEGHCAPFNPLLTDHEGLAGGYGFGPSPLSAEDHRTFELCIPLALLGVSTGDTLGFVAASEYEPGIFDDWNYDESYWPIYDVDVYEQSMYGDLVLAVNAPETTASLSGTLGGGGWYTSDVTVTLEATGGEGGVNYTRYSVDGGAWTMYTGPFTVSSEGVTTVEFYSVDMVGNEESVKSVDVMIDTVAPATSHSVDGFTVTLTASDASSGVAVSYYRIDGGSWATYSSPFTVTGAGSHTVEYYSVDVAGNEEAAESFSLSEEDDPPTTEASLSGTAGLGGWYVSDVEVTLTADDGTGSGIDATFYRINDGSLRTYSSPFDLTAEGTFVIEYYSVDNSGNEEDARTVTVRIDSVAPVTTCSVEGSTVTLAATDATSGVAAIMYRIDGGDWETYDGPFEVGGSGNRTVEFYAVDAAGNQETAQSVLVEGSGGGISVLLIGGIIAAAIVAAVLMLLFLIMRKKRQGPAPMGPPPPPPPV